MNNSSDSFFQNERNFVQVIRGFFPQSLLVDFRQEILEARAKNGDVPCPSQNPRAEIQGVLPDLIRLNKRWYDIWRFVDLTLLPEAVSDFNQMIFPPQIRHMKKESHKVPWHQDMAYQKSLGKRGHKRLMTCWVPLDDNPKICPTLEFALSSKQVPVEHVDSGIFHNVMPDEKFEETVIFDLDLGDVLVFGDLIPHRTFLRPGYAHTRLSMEYRMTNAGNLLPEKDYFDLTKKVFYRTKEQENGQAVR